MTIPRCSQDQCFVTFELSFVRREAGIKTHVGTDLTSLSKMTCEESVSWIPLGAVNIIFLLEALNFVRQE
jgi:hypothetical protein